MFPLVRRGRTSVFIAFLAFVAGFAPGCSRGEQPAPADPPAQPKPAAPAAASDPDDDRGKVVCLGDSLTAGLGLVETQSFPSVLQKKIDAAQYPFEVLNRGVSGDTSAGGLRRLDWVLQGDVKVLVVALGGNDALRGLSVADMRKNLATIIERARDKGVIVVLAGMQAPPNFGEEYTVAFRQAYIELAREYRTPLVPFLLDKVAGQPELNQADGIHPNTRGAEILADNVWSVLRPLLQQMSAQ